MPSLIALLIMVSFTRSVVGLRPLFNDIRSMKWSIKRLLCTSQDYFDTKVQETYEKLSRRRMITSEDNFKVKQVKSLQQKRKRDKANLILLEGHRQVIDALRFGSKPHHIFITEKGIDGPMGYSLWKPCHSGAPSR